MAIKYGIETSVSEAVVADAFRVVFFSRPSLRDRLRMDRYSQWRSQARWEELQISNSLVAAEFVGGAVSLAGGASSLLGTRVALSACAVGSGTPYEIWLVHYQTSLGINLAGSALKVYSREVARTLERMGAVAGIVKT